MCKPALRISSAFMVVSLGRVWPACESLGLSSLRQTVTAVFDCSAFRVTYLGRAWPACQN
ncbi:unnamed protein product [Ixodes hexagonus]